jgi:predicted ATPase
MHSPLVGRSGEQNRLDEIVHDLEGGRGCVVTIVGEPGIGKSRLLIEARNTHSGLPLRWVEGRAYSYTEDQPFSVILDFLSELLDIAPDDPPAMLDLKLETSIRPILGEELAEVWPYLASLLAAPIPPQYADVVKQLDPEALNAKIVNAVIILVEAVAARQPLVLSFEDLHWADHSSLGLIFRPDRDKPSWELKIRAETEFAHRYAHLALVPLDESSSKELVGNLLAITDIPEPVGDLIRSRSEGNPFYMEELLRELIERGVLVQRDGAWESSEAIAEVVVPETLEKIVQARLDRLPMPERSTLQAASVIGRRFPFRVLEAIASSNGDLRDHLLRLQQADLVRERARIPELEYIFKHHVVQEVTYGTLLQEQCSQLHRQVAESLIDLFPERIDELHGNLARHYAQAGDAELAAEHYEQAARRAEEIFAYEEAAQLLELALEATPEGEKTEKRAARLESLGDVRTYLGENALAVATYQEALDLWQSSDDMDKWTSVRLLRKIGDAVALTQTHEDREQLDDVGKKSLKLATDQTTGEPPHPEAARVLMARFLLEVGRAIRQDWGAAEAHAQAALKMAEQLGDPTLLSDALAATELIYHGRGEIHEQLQIALRRVELARDPNFRGLRARASALLSAGVAHKNVGNFGEAMPLLEEAYILAQEIQAISLQADALGEQAECWFRQDRWDAVVELDERLLALHSRYGISRAGPICFSLGFSASVNALRGNPERARELREEAYQIMITAGGGSENDWVRNQHY